MSLKIGDQRKKSCTFIVLKKKRLQTIFAMVAYGMSFKL